jgi:hypothetical protein
MERSGGGYPLLAGEGEGLATGPSDSAIIRLAITTQPSQM